jgi:hypothetical protein
MPRSPVAARLLFRRVEGRFGWRDRYRAFEGISPWLFCIITGNRPTVGVRNRRQIQVALRLIRCQFNSWFFAASFLGNQFVSVHITRARLACPELVADPDFVDDKLVSDKVVIRKLVDLQFSSGNFARQSRRSFASASPPPASPPTTPT